MIIVTLTYVTLVMRADNDARAGIMALITLVRQGLAKTRAGRGEPPCWPRSGCSVRRCSSATLDLRLHGREHLEMAGVIMLVAAVRTATHRTARARPARRLASARPGFWPAPGGPA